MSQPCSAFRRKDGTLVLACDGDNHRDERLVTSADGDRTWRVARGDLRKAAGKYANNKKKLGIGGTFAALSHDDGRTWPCILALEGVGAYLAAAQASDGVIHFFESRMSCVAFNESWLM